MLESINVEIKFGEKTQTDAIQQIDTFKVNEVFDQPDDSKVCPIQKEKYQLVDSDKKPLVQAKNGPNYTNDTTTLNIQVDTQVVFNSQEATFMIQAESLGGVKAYKEVNIKLTKVLLDSENKSPHFESPLQEI